MHGTQYILFRRLAHRILLIIREDDHILPGVAKVAVEVCRHILDVIDTTSELPSLSEVVDSYQ